MNVTVNLNVFPGPDNFVVGLADTATITSGNQLIAEDGTSLVAEDGTQLIAE